MEPLPPVDLFGPAHLCALLSTITIAVGLAAALRRWPSVRFEQGLRIGLALVLVVMTGLHVHWVTQHREVVVWEFLPLHLCDLQIFVALYALASKQRLAAELLYFWSCSGTFLAMVIPAIDRGFPTLRFFIYFSLHGGVIVTAAVLIYGMQLYPDRRSPRRAFGLTLIYMAMIAVVDFAFGQNYLFLAHKPDEATLLDYMGPWPVYIVVALVIGYGLFLVLGFPFRGHEPDRG